MTIEEAIRARVGGLASVIALVGSRVHLDRLPQSPTYPAVCVQLIDDGSSYHLRGPIGTTQARVQVDAYVKEGSGLDAYSRVSSLAAAIHGDGRGPTATGLSGWIGSIGSPALDVLSCFRVSRTRRYDPDELHVLTQSQDYMVWFRA